jgi:hypothetical protein
VYNGYAPEDSETFVRLACKQLEGVESIQIGQRLLFIVPQKA